MLVMGPSYNEGVFLEAIFLKMEGRKLYKYALQTVAIAIKQCLDKAGIPISEVSKILIHQEELGDVVSLALRGARFEAGHLIFETEAPVLVGAHAGNH